MNPLPTERVINSKPQTWAEAVDLLRQDAAFAQLVRDCYWDDEAIVAARRYAVSAEWMALRTWLPARRGRALELGAGRGIASYALACEGFETTALEPDASAEVGACAITSMARQSGVPLRVVRASAERLPFRDSSFQLVFCRQALHHLRDLPACMREVFRVLDRGGLFIAIREPVVSGPKQLRRFLDGHPLHRYFGGENAFSLDVYAQAIRDGGLHLERIVNPFASDVNLAPTTQQAVRHAISRRAHIPDWMISDTSLWLRGVLAGSPGRHYSFVARRPYHALARPRKRVDAVLAIERMLDLGRA